jgi:hypothetical protein
MSGRCQVVMLCAYWGQAARVWTWLGCLLAAVAHALLGDLRGAVAPLRGRGPMSGHVRSLCVTLASSPALVVAGLLAAVAHALLGGLGGAETPLRDR